jgi:hypothetical protein
VQLIYKTLFRISRIAKTHNNASSWLQNFLGVDDDDDDDLMKSLSYEAAPSDFWMHIFSPMHRSANPVQNNPKGTIPWVCETNFDSLDWWSFWHMKVTSAEEIYAAAVADDDENDLTKHQSYTLPC